MSALRSFLHLPQKRAQDALTAGAWNRLKDRADTLRNDPRYLSPGHARLILQALGSDDTTAPDILRLNLCLLGAVEFQQQGLPLVRANPDPASRRRDGNASRAGMRR